MFDIIVATIFTAVTVVCTVGLFIAPQLKESTNPTLAALGEGWYLSAQFQRSGPVHLNAAMSVVNLLFAILAFMVEWDYTGMYLVVTAASPLFLLPALRAHYDRLERKVVEA